MITHQEVDLLVNYTAREGVAISFYLNTDSTELSKAAWNIETKDLVKKARKELEKMNVARRYYEAADDTLRRIQSFISTESFAPRYKSVAIFANSVENFYQIYHLPIAVKSNLVLDNNFYVRPLIALLEEHYRIGVVVVDSQRSRLFEVYMGEIIEHGDFATKVKSPRKPLMETFMKREKRLMQRKEEATRFHLSSTAEALRAHFALRHFDKLIVGGRRPMGDHLARLLHRDLQSSLIGVIDMDLNEKENEVLARSVRTEELYKSEEERTLLRKIGGELEKDGYAVKGVSRVIKSAQEYNLQTIVVAQDFSTPGLVCPQCGMPHYEESTCVCCGEALVTVPDVVYDIVEEAARQRAVVRHIRGGNLIASLENIAALIKFKQGELAFSEEALETEI